MSDNHAYPRGFSPLLFWLWVLALSWPEALPFVIRLVGKKRIERAFQNFADSLPAASEV